MDDQDATGGGGATRSSRRTGSARQFWAFFWLTIIGLAALYGYAQWIAAVSRVVVDEAGQVKVSPQWAVQWQSIAKDLISMTKIEINEVTRDRLNAKIDAQVEAAFSPVYDQIPTFAEFHYSVVGEYAELGAALIGSGANSMQQMLFQDINFDVRLNRAADKISRSFQNILGEALAKIRGKLEAVPDLDSDERGLLTEALQLMTADVNARFRSELVGLRAGGAGMAGIYIASKAAGKKTGTVLAKKVASKAAAKAAAKAAPGAAGIGGAMACSWLGLFGAGACGVGAATITWLTTDAIIVNIDELYNRPEFEAEIGRLVDEQKNAVKEGIKASYAALLDAITKDIDSKIKATTPAEAVNG